MLPQGAIGLPGSGRTKFDRSLTLYWHRNGIGCVATGHRGRMEGVTRCRRWTVARFSPHVDRAARSEGPSVAHRQSWVGVLSAPTDNIMVCSHQIN